MKCQAAEFKLPALNQDPGAVLIVDDQLALLRSLQALLRINGYAVELAADGAEAINKLQEGKFDLVLLDLQMPGIDGLEVLEYIRRENLDPEIIIISGVSSFSSFKRVLHLGAYDFIRKPYDPEELLASVREGILRCRQRRQAARIEQSLLKSERMHRFIVNHSPDFIYVLNPAGLFTYVNDTVENLLGFKRHELLGKHFSTIIHVNNAEEIHNIFSEHRTGSRAGNKIEMRLQVNPRTEQSCNLDSQEVIVELSAVGLYRKDAAGKKHFSGTLGCARDISARKKTEARISFQAYHDMLTQLPNRTLFDDRIKQTFAHARRSSEKFAVMFLDLDRFKLINDTFGHVMGDLVLQQVAQRTLGCLREEDTLSRFGGDEFFLLLPRISSRDDVAAVAEKILREIRQPVRIDSQELFLSVSIGIALFPDAGLSKEALLQSADIAMYQVKKNGKDGYCFYSEGMDNQSGFLSVERDLGQGLTNKQFQVYFQPKVDSSSHRIIGMEALLRWQHPERGLLFPEEFLPAAEESKLIVPIGQWVLWSVCEEIVRWQQQGLPQIKVSLNISPVQLEQDDFVENFIKIVQEFGLAADIFELEITEQGVLDAPSLVADKLNSLREFGVSVTLDDFGRGHFSFSYLQNFPVNTLKIDRSFVREIAAGKKHPYVADGIAMLAKGMHLNLVAEGVENQLQLNYLRELGCREVQGHLYAAAISAPATLALLKAGSANGPHFTLH